MKRILSVSEAVRAAQILFELNTEGTQALAFAEKIGIPRNAMEERKRFLEEWRAYVYAAVLNALMEKCPNIVVVEYLRNTQAVLARLGYDAQAGEAFVDGPFRAYSDSIVQGKLKDCPLILTQRLFGKKLEEIPSHEAGLLSACMAMIAAALLDKLEQYDFDPDKP